jgi:hypothetical protein
MSSHPRSRSIDRAFWSTGRRRATAILLAFLAIFPGRSAAGECTAIDDPLQLLDLHLEILLGLFLSDDPAHPFRWALPDVVLAPGGRLLVWCDDDLGEGPNHAGFQLDRDGESVGLYEDSAGIVHVLDFIRFGPQETDRSFGRFPDGAALVIPLPCPSPGLANEGQCAKPAFLRGDCIDDGKVDVSDAVCFLNWLFLGGTEPGCLAAANVNGSGVPSITDPIYLLTHLFLGGPPPAQPFPGCGPGALESDKEIGCQTPPGSCQP